MAETGAAGTDVTGTGAATEDETGTGVATEDVTGTGTGLPRADGDRLAPTTGGPVRHNMERPSQPKRQSRRRLPKRGRRDDTTPRSRPAPTIRDGSVQRTTSMLVAPFRRRPDTPETYTNRCGRAGMAIASSMSEAQRPIFGRRAVELRSARRRSRCCGSQSSVSDDGARE